MNKFLQVEHFESQCHWQTLLPATPKTLYKGMGAEKQHHHASEKTEVWAEAQRQPPGAAAPSATGWCPALQQRAEWLYPSVSSKPVFSRRSGFWVICQDYE